MYWDCPKCAAENSLDASCCWRCGFQNYGGAPGAAPPREGPPKSTDLLEGQRKTIKEEMRKGLEDGLARSRAALDRLAGGRPTSEKARSRANPTPPKEVPEPD
jgi:hypothetical protein